MDEGIIMCTCIIAVSNSEYTTIENNAIKDLLNEGWTIDEVFNEPDAQMVQLKRQWP